MIMRADKLAHSIARPREVQSGSQEHEFQFRGDVDAHSGSKSGVKNLQNRAREAEQKRQWPHQNDKELSNRRAALPVSLWHTFCDGANSLEYFLYLRLQYFRYASQMFVS